MMNRDEAVQKLARQALISTARAEDLYDSFFEKPVVPQYVADWYEEHKDDFETNLFNCPYEVISQGGDTEFGEWFKAGINTPYQTLVNMHQFGYEVEKETKCRVRVKGIDGYCKYLNRDTKTQKWFFASKEKTDRFIPEHTRKELEDAGFGWVFNCEGIEIEEVE